MQQVLIVNAAFDRSPPSDGFGRSNHVACSDVSPVSFFSPIQRPASLRSFPPLFFNPCPY
ncbi:hypothetical protein EXIGLDRAFT_301382 [Exidia glandulosa HHB12029]|uniref:Uncharacterized protein n=1 Tax=Exidia glandulosa HHB12029 TaxID=1314781 RepID=A0A165D7Q8_EXIGL|nr:hypothetical protein EXIGLDRAFT_301382 [Exidia glandulosa HHB12029]